MENVTKAVNAFERVCTHADTANPYMHSNLAKNGKSGIWLFGLELSVLKTMMSFTIGTLKVRLSLRKLRQSVLLTGEYISTNITDVEYDQFADAARRLSRCHERNVRAYREIICHYVDGLAPVRDRFSWVTQYVIRMSLGLGGEIPVR